MNIRPSAPYGRGLGLLMFGGPRCRPRDGSALRTQALSKDVAKASFWSVGGAVVLSRLAPLQAQTLELLFPAAIAPGPPETCREGQQKPSHSRAAHRVVQGGASSAFPGSGNLFSKFQINPDKRPPGPFTTPPSATTPCTLMISCLDLQKG